MMDKTPLISSLSNPVIETMFMTVEEAVTASGLPVHIIRKLICKPGFPGMKVGKRWWIHREKFREWMDKQIDEQAS
jgi:excisionase family DNA binding protein